MHIDGQRSDAHVTEVGMMIVGRQSCMHIDGQRHKFSNDRNVCDATRVKLAPTPEMERSLNSRTPDKVVCVVVPFSLAFSVTIPFDRSDRGTVVGVAQTLFLCRLH
jgi:hypothetical protein